MRRWTVYKLDRGLGPHKADWEALSESLTAGNPMLAATFVDNLLRHLGKGDEHLCVFHVDQRVVGMCILHPLTAGAWTSFLPPQAQLGLLLSRDARWLEHLFRDLPGLPLRIDLLASEKQSNWEGGPAKRPYRRFDHALTIAVSLHGGFDAYWRGRPKKLQANMARYLRRLSSEAADHRFEEIRTPALIGSALERYSALESAGWKGKVGTAIALGTPQGRFYADLVEAYSVRGQASVYELWLQGQLAASRIVLRSGDLFVMLKTTYDESLSHFAPGRILLKHVLESLFLQAPNGNVEFYTDANQDLVGWGTSYRWIQHVSLFRSSPVAWVDSVRRWPRTRLGCGAVLDPSESIALYSHPDEFPEDVRNLFDSDSDQLLESGTLWYRNLVDTVFASGPKVTFLVLRSDGRAVAALPVMLQRERWGTQVRALSNFYTALYTPVLAPTARTDSLRPLVAAARRLHAGATGMQFAPMDPDARTFQALKWALIDNGLPIFSYYCFGNWYLDVTCDWATYLQQRHGRLRNTIRRMGRRFALAGGTLQIHSSADEVSTVLRDYEQVYSESWKAAEPFAGFMPGLIRACAERGWMRLAVARLHGRPVAAQFWIVTGGKARIYKLAHDKQFHAYAPGTLLTAMLMEHVIDKDKVLEVDYLIGDDGYKSEWMSSRRERWGLVAYEPLRMLGLLGFAREVSGRLFRRFLMGDAPRHTPRFDRLGALAIESEGGRTSTGPASRVEVVEHVGLESLPADVVELFAWAERESPELSLPWYRNLVDSVYTEDKGVRLYVVRQDGVPMAALPVRRVATPLGHRIESLANFYSAIYSPAMHPEVSVDDLVALLRAVVRSTGGLSSIRLSPMDPSAGSFNMLLDAFRLAGIPAFRYYCFGNWYLPVKQDWEGYLKTRSSTLRNTIKRLGKRLLTDGGSLEVLQNGPEALRAVEAFQKVYSASWKVAEPYSEFVPNLIRKAAELGWLRIGIARIGDKPIAAQVWLVAHDRAEIFKVAYDEEYQSYSPGTLVTALLMKHVIDVDRVVEVDYLIGDDAYKRTWMPERRERFGIIAYNPRTPGGLIGLLRERAGRAYRRVRPKPKQDFKATSASRQAGAALSTGKGDSVRARNP